MNDSDIHQCDDRPFMGRLAMGIDPAGEGDDETVWVIRDSIKAKIIFKEKISSPKGIAQKTATLMTEYKIEAENVVVDNFGV